MKVDEDILGALRAAGEGYVSGRLLAEDLGVSRTTVWKRISRLRDRGYDIQSSRRLGYRLMGAPDLLLSAEIREGLKTTIMGRQIEYFERTGSTVQAARRAASEGCVEGTIILAEEQTAGRGRLGRPWVSPPGGIWLSVVLRPLMAPADTPKLTFLMAVSAAQAVAAETGIELGIKWPNDLVSAGQKVGGILCEIDAEPDTVIFAILSLGLNANLRADQFPRGLRSRLTSLKTVAGDPVDRAALVRAILTRLETHYAFIQEGDFSSVLTGWEARSDTIGQRVRVSTPQGELEGQALGIDEHGALRLRLDSGSVRSVASGDTTVL